MEDREIETRILGKKGSFVMSKALQSVTASSSNESALPCIVCKCALPNIPGTHNQPSGGTEFMTEGHYGSTVFDPMDGSILAINICDQCLTAALSSGLVLRVGGPDIQTMDHL